MASPFLRFGLLLLGVAACGPQSGFSIQVISGDQQSALVGEELAEPLVGRLVDRNGVPVPFQAVGFAVLSGDGEVFAGAATSNRDGLIKERWTLGLHSQVPQVVEVRLIDGTSGDPVVLGRFTARALPLEPHQLRSAGTVAGAAGEVVEARVQVVDKYENPVPHAVVDWEHTATVARLEPESFGGEDGIASMRYRLPANLTTSPLQVQRVKVAVRRAPAVATEVELRAAPGVPAQLVPENLDCLGGLPGMKPLRPPAFIVKDAHGNAVPGAKVTLRIVEGGGGLDLKGNNWDYPSPTGPNPYVTPDVSRPIEGTVTADADGRAPPRDLLGGNYWVLGRAAGRNVLSASVPGGPELRFTAEAHSPFIAFSGAWFRSGGTSGTLRVGAYWCTLSKDGATGTVAAGHGQPVPLGFVATSFWPHCVAGTDLYVPEGADPVVLTLTARDPDGSMHSSSVVIRDSEAAQ